MAISRSQLLKELLPGLNALFGLEYAKYGEEHKEIFETESSDRSFEEEVKLSGFSAAPVKGEGSAIEYDNAQEAWSLLAIRTKLLQWASLLLKKLLKITCTTLCRLVIRRHWLVLWRTPSKLKVQPFLTTLSPVLRMVTAKLLCTTDHPLFVAALTQTVLLLRLTLTKLRLEAAVIQIAGLD